MNPKEHGFFERSKTSTIIEMKGITKELFLEVAKNKYGDKFDYDNVVFVKPFLKVTIKCNTCGRTFQQTPNDHISVIEPCLVCSYKKRAEKMRKPFEETLAEMKRVHKGKYSYPDSELYYKGVQKEIPVVCPIHGEFWITPSKHMAGQACYKCGIERITERNRIPFEEFVRRASEAHNGFYNYEKTQIGYTGVHKMGIITCPIHGDFSQWLIAHYKGQGCPECGHIRTAAKKQTPFSAFKKKAEATHGEGRFIYSEEHYTNYSTKTLIKCTVCGRSFWQLPYSHVYGNGCQKCTFSKLENRVEQVLKALEVKYAREKRFKWLRYKRKMRLDFYLPEYKIAIECQGQQHFKTVDFAGRGKEWAEEQLAINLEKDSIKKRLCEEHGIQVLYCNYNLTIRKNTP